MSEIAAIPTLPWQRRDCSRLAGFGILGFGLLAVAWTGTSGTTRFAGQVAWANVGGAGLLSVVVGCAVWVHTGRRRVKFRLAATPFVRRAGLTNGVPAGVAQDGAVAFVWAAGMTRYHRPDCQAAAGKPVTSAGADAHRAEGRQPCGLCSGGHPHTPEVDP